MKTRMLTNRWCTIVACLALGLLFAVPSVAFARSGKAPKVFDINYSLDGGTNPPGAPQSYVVGTGTTLPVPTKANSAFKGWYADAGFNGNPATVIGSSENGIKDFWAKWGPGSHLVTFDSSGGCAVDSAAVNDGNRVSKPVDPRKVGHTFRRWQLDGAVYDFDTPVTGAITLTAVYTANSYDIDYALNGGNNPDDAPGRYTYGKGAKLSVPTRTGATFRGWYTDDGLHGKPVDAIGDEVAGDKRFFAKWEERGVHRKADARRAMVVEEIVGGGGGLQPVDPVTQNGGSRARRHGGDPEIRRISLASSMWGRMLAKHPFDYHVHIHSLVSTPIRARLKPVIPGLMR